MQLTVVILAQDALPALVIFAIASDPLFLACAVILSLFLCCHGGIVCALLSEVETLCWVDLTSNGLLKVLIRNLAVMVGIELIEERLELSLGDAPETPVLKVEFQLFGFDGPRLLHVHIHEGFP